MITKEEYLKAKEIVREYEKNLKHYSIGVISKDVEDFLLWKKDMKLIGNTFDDIRKFKIGNTTYNCISNLSDFCSLTLNEIIETKNAKENEIYKDIKTYILICNINENA